MDLVSKLKNILFEEEEVEIPVIEKKEKKPAISTYKEMPRKEEAPKKEVDYSSFYDEEREQKKPERKIEEIPRKQEIVSEREIFRSDNTFNFPDFDEEEFKKMTPKRTTNVMEYERKRTEKKNEYKRAEKKEEEKASKPKFKPSPIISPVYGILDKNYTPDEITTRKEDPIARNLDVDSVRKKAFGSLEEKKEIKEEIVIPEATSDEEILEEKLEKARTIDELLKDSSDDYIEVDNSTIEENKPLEEEIDSLEEEELKKKTTSEEEEDTLESDLFDLIDSMYENREDGE